MSTENKSCAPRFRFPGFTGEWVEKTLGEVSERITDKVNDIELEPISVSAGIGIVSQKQKFGKDISGMQYKNYIHIKKGDFCYNKGYSKRFPQGSIYELIDFEEAAAPNAFISFRFREDVCPHFFSGYFENNVHGRQLAQYITSGARADGLLNLNPNDFFKIKFLVPPTLAEQEKIASVLMEMDDFIAAQANKVDALKEEKKGLMQQLFPQDGETSPRMRLAGCSGDWEEKRLGDVCDNMLVGFPFKGQDITNDKSGHPILRAYSIGTGCIMHGEGYDKYFPHDAKALEKYMVRSGDIVIAMDGSVGRNIAMVSDAEDGFLLIQRVARLRIKDYPIQLIYQQIISQRFKDFASAEKVGSIISHISQKQIESFPIYLPFSKDEQQKIAECLSALDDQIVAESAKLEALKDHKKGLMQQLFPQPEK